MSKDTPGMPTASEVANTPMRSGVGLRLNFLQMIYRLRLTLGGLKSREMAKFSKSSSVYPN
ncbi:MAG: hypothetical protein ACJAXK_000794 [Yoonia sp.]|jgi:hypothetical protein